MPESEGVEITIVVPEEHEMAAIDLPETVAGLLLKEGSESHQQLMFESRANSQHTNNLVRTVATHKFAEVGPIESRAVSGVMATPIASPTTQAGG